MTADRGLALKRRRVLAATAGLVGLAGCGGGNGGNSGNGGNGGNSGNGGDGGNSGNGGDGLYEGGDFTCIDVGEASRTQYDASGTAFLFDFEYPDVFDTVTERGSPVERLEFVRRFGGDKSYTEDRLLLTVDLTDTGVERSKVKTDGEAVSEVEFGDRTAYVSPTLGITGEPNRGRFTADVPHEVDGDVRYFPTQFILSISLQTVSGDPDIPEDCATTLDETCRAIAESVVPNAETAFEETREE